MAKPIGNQVANLKTNDKVSYNVKQKYLSKSDGPGYAGPDKDKQGERAKPKYKSRKK